MRAIINVAKPAAKSNEILVRVHASSVSKADIMMRTGKPCTGLARAQEPLGEPVMSESELAVFVPAFESSGFAGTINWHRNLDANWHLLNDDPMIQQPVLMIYGNQDMIRKFDGLSTFVPDVEEVRIDCGHWIQQEKPGETNQAMLN